MINLEPNRFNEDILCSMRDILEKQEQAEVNMGNGEKIIMLSEQEYRNMMETIYFTSNPELRDSILEGMATPLEDCISSDKVEW